MSWSCDARAGARLDFINALIAAQGNKMQNEWTTKKGTYFYEVGKEQRDGSIVGQIHRNTTPGMCKRSGRFRIEPNGRVSAGPAIFQTSCIMVTIYSNAAGSIPFRAQFKELETFESKFDCTMDLCNDLQPGAIMELYIFIGAIISIDTISETKNGFIVVLDGIQGKNRKNVDVEASAFKSLADACYAVCDFFPNEMHNQIHFMYTDGQKSLEYTP